MSKASDMAKVSVKGGFHLLWGLVASTVISAVGTIIIAWLLGESNYGLYAIALTAPNLIATFRDMGINSAMIKYTAQYNAENQADKVKGIFVSGLVFETALGLALSMISFLLSGFLAENVFQRPAIVTLIQIASFIILTGALSTAATAAFTGMEKMHLNSIMLVCQSVIKTILVILLVVLGLGTFGALIGYTIAFLIAGIIGVLLLWTIYKTLPTPPGGRLKIKENIKTMFKYGLPLSISAILGGFLTQYYSILMAIYVKNDALIGNYSVAMNFVVLITFFATPVTTMLFPAFSKLNPQKDHETLKNVFQFSVKYAALLVVPVTAMIIALSQPAISTIFGGRYSEAPLFLALLAIAYLYSAFGNLSTGNLINSQGQTKFNLYLTILTAAIGFPMGFVLISQFGIIGLIITTLVTSIPSLIVSLYWLKKRYRVTVDWIASAKILLSSLVAAGLTYFIITQLSFSSWIRLAIGVAIFLLIFFASTLLTKTVSKADIANMRGMLSALGPLQKLFSRILDFIEKIITKLRL
jgi:O-antigen/teichoic acid export membrane protein